MTFQQSLRRLLENPTSSIDEKQAEVTRAILATIGNNIALNPGGDGLSSAWCKGYNSAQDDLREALEKAE